MKFINTVVEISLGEFNIHTIDAHIVESVDTKFPKELHEGKILFYVDVSDLNSLEEDIEKIKVVAKQFNQDGGHEAYWERVHQEEKEAI